MHVHLYEGSYITLCYIVVAILLIGNLNLVETCVSILCAKGWNALYVVDWNLAVVSTSSMFSASPYIADFGKVKTSFHRLTCY